MCVFGPVILLGTHKKVVISFKTRKKFKVEEHVLIYTVNIFVFMPTIDANVNIFFFMEEGPKWQKCPGRGRVSSDSRGLI